MKKRLLSLVLTLSLSLSLCLTPALAAAGLSNFTKSKPYTPGQFTDVASSTWYTSAVQAAYEYGLMQGSSDTTFNVSGKLTIGETIAIAARLHATYQGNGHTFSTSEPWYQTYVDYALTNGICQAYPDYTAVISRASFAMILTNALPPEALTAINTVEENGIPDVPSDANYAKKSTQYKGMDDRLSSMYATMGTQELSHVDTLHEQAVRLIQAQRSEGKEIPAGMQAVWDWEHSHMMDRVARIKVLLETARR